MVWELPPFARERLERGRLLLQDSEEHEGSSDLARYVEQVDFTVGLHRIFLADSSHLRRGLTVRDKEQGLALLVHVALCGLAAPIKSVDLDDLCAEALMQTISELLTADLRMVHGGACMRLLARICNFVAHALTGGVEHLPTMLRDIETLTGPPREAAITQLNFERLEQHTASFDTNVTAADMGRLTGLLKLYASHRLVQHGFHSTALIRTALSAIGELQAQGGGEDAPFLHRRKADVLYAAGRLREALAEQREALRLATAEKAHVSVVASCLNASMLLMAGASGPRFSRREVEGLLAQAQRARRLCKGWLPKVAADAYKEALSEKRETLAEAAASQPGTDVLDTIFDDLEPSGGTTMPRCTGCGRPSSTLLKCSQCRNAAYCSKPCQTQHWKFGGHKEECQPQTQAS